MTILEKIKETISSIHILRSTDSEGVGASSRVSREKFRRLFSSVGKRLSAVWQGICRSLSPVLRRVKRHLGSLPIPAWLFAIFTAVYCELLLHLWISETLIPGRLAAVLAFALGFGGILAQIVSFLGQKRWGKWVSVALVGLVAALYITEYFILDAYMTFMTLGTVFGGAKGVATDFADVAFGLIFRGFWRILVMLLPVFAYALLAKPVATSWRLRWFGLVLALAGYAGGFVIVDAVDLDGDRLDSAYNFDSAIRCFGLNMGVTLDAFRSGGNEEMDFVMVAPTPVPQATQPAQTPEAETPEETQAVSYEPNVMDIDFAALAESESNGRVAKLHSYVNSLTPSMENEYTGLFAGKNLILITAEAFTAEVIDPELTPTLYRLANEGIHFTEYYQPAWGASTTSGEFSNLIGLVPANGGACMKEVNQQNLFLTMGHQLQRLGYSSVAYHNHVGTFYDRHKTHTQLGYDKFIALDFGLEGVSRRFPESDLEMMVSTVPQYIDQQPFSVYYMTVSGHSVYALDVNESAKRNYDKVKDMEGSEPVKVYKAANLELENAMASLVGQLEEAGIADDTVIVISTDHYPYGLEQSQAYNNSKNYLKELYGVDTVTKFVRDHNALIIWSGCLEGMNLEIDTPVYSLDILPTISNLFGVDYDSRLLVGRDVFSDQEPLVLWPDYSWITDKGTFDFATGTFTPREGVEVDESYVQRMKSIVSNKISYSKEAQNQNYFNYLWKDLTERGVYQD